MSEIAARESRPAPGLWSYVALVFALASAGVWVLAGIVDDGLYMITGILGIIGFASGLKARRAARRTGGRRWPAFVGIGLGGLLGGAVIVASIVYGISHAV